MQKAHILLVEDDLADVELMFYALQESGIHKELLSVSTGQEALDILFQQGKHTNAVIPAMVILDIQLPDKSGIDILKEIRKHPDTQHIPVLMLTASTDKSIVTKAYASGCNSFITKPIDMNDFIASMERLDKFWFHIAKLPNTKAF